MTMTLKSPELIEKLTDGMVTRLMMRQSLFDLAKDCFSPKFGLQTACLKATNKRRAMNYSKSEWGIVRNILVWQFPDHSIYSNNETMAWNDLH